MRATAMALILLLALPTLALGTHAEIVINIRSPALGEMWTDCPDEIILGYDGTRPVDRLVTRVLDSEGTELTRHERGPAHLLFGVIKPREAATPWPAGELTIEVTSQKGGASATATRTVSYAPFDDTTGPVINRIYTLGSPTVDEWHVEPAIVNAASLDDCRAGTVDFAVNGEPVANAQGPRGLGLIGRFAHVAWGNHLFDTDGTFAVEIHGVDEAGNVGPVHEETIRVDLTAPRPTVHLTPFELLRPEDGASVGLPTWVELGGDTILLTGCQFFTAQTDVAGLATVSLEWYVDGSSTGQHDTEALLCFDAAGPHDVSVIARDRAGRIGGSEPIRVHVLCNQGFVAPQCTAPPMG